MYVRRPPSDHAEWQCCKTSDSDRYISPDIRKTPNPDPNNVDTQTDETPSSLKASTLELREEMKQVLASYGISNSDIDDMWETVMARSSKTNWLGS